MSGPTPNVPKKNPTTASRDCRAISGSASMRLMPPRPLLTPAS
jgi:hypothetical protein